jgi:hypothetical protein
LDLRDFPASWIDYLRLPPPPREPPAREPPILDAPRELLERAPLAPPEEPPKAPPPLELDDALRFPPRSPLPPLFESMLLALGRLPPRSEAPARSPPLSPAPPDARFAPLSPAPPDARLPAPCCCRWRASAWRFPIESPRAVPPYLFAVDRFA